jgi:GNAT superfamily N-acetyltransferase
MDIMLALARALADDDATRARCWPVHAPAAPASRRTAIPRAGAPADYTGGLALLYADRGGEVVGCAGFRISEWLAWGARSTIDDLVADEHERSRGVGRALMGWLAAHARPRVAHSCISIPAFSASARIASISCRACTSARITLPWSSSLRHRWERPSGRDAGHLPGL